MKFSIAIQAGGESRRMGQDKGLASFLGKPLVARLVERLAPLADEVLVTTNRLQEYAFLGVPLFPDILPGCGALGGLYTALSAASHPLVAVIACDMPFVNALLLAAQRDLLVACQADIVIPHTGGGLEPFHAVYRREVCLPHILAALEAGKWRADAWFDQVDLRVLSAGEISKYDPGMLSFRNINTPEELQAAEKLALQFANRATGA